MPRPYSPLPDDDSSTYFELLEKQQPIIDTTLYAVNAYTTSQIKQLNLMVTKKSLDALDDILTQLNELLFNTYEGADKDFLTLQKKLQPEILAPNTLLDEIDREHIRIFAGMTVLEYATNITLRIEIPRNRKLALLTKIKTAKDFLKSKHDGINILWAEVAHSQKQLNHEKQLARHKRNHRIIQSSITTPGLLLGGGAVAVAALAFFTFGLGLLALAPLIVTLIIATGDGSGLYVESRRHRHKQKNSNRLFRLNSPLNKQHHEAHHQAINTKYFSPPS